MGRRGQERARLVKEWQAWRAALCRLELTGGSSIALQLPLIMPPYVYETKACWIDLPDGTSDRLGYSSLEASPFYSHIPLLNTSHLSRLSPHHFFRSHLHSHVLSPISSRSHSHAHSHSPMTSPSTSQPSSP